VVDLGRGVHGRAAAQPAQQLREQALRPVPRRLEILDVHVDLPAVRWEVATAGWEVQG
jgi:hypothetical protein